MLELIIIATFIGLLVLFIRKRKKMVGLEDAIMQSHKLDNWGITADYCLRNGISEKRMDKCINEILHRLAEQGEIMAMRYMAVHAGSSEKECMWYTRCAEAGDKDAMYWLGLKYSSTVNAAGGAGGYGSNPELSFYWFNQAANRRHSAAMERVASCHYFGQGVEKNEEEAFRIAQHFWERGNSECGLFLTSIFYQNPTSEKYDIPRAITILERIMIRGEKKMYTEAASSLGHIFGAPFMHPGIPVRDYHDCRKAAYCFALAFVAGDSLSDVMAQNIAKTGYNYTDHEFAQWYSDAKNYRYNPM